MNLKDTSTDEFLKAIGIVETNRIRLAAAFNAVHSAMGHMDNGQLKLFRDSDVGQATIKLANAYGGREMGLRHDF